MILVTGSTGGIGKELVGHLSKIDDILGIYNTTAPKDIPSGKVRYEKLNIEDPAEIRSFAQKYNGQFSNLTLVHAAVCNRDGLCAAYNETDWDKVMQVNVKGDFLLTQALLPQMIREKWGRVIHISSVIGVEGAIGTVAYSASKTALLGMSRVLALEYGRFNITSNILTLGYFESGLAESLADKVKSDILSRVPSKLFGKVADIACAVEFLIQAGYVNGSVITIDGALR